MGLSRNKVAVPEGAAGTPPFWRGRLSVLRDKNKRTKEEVWFQTQSFLTADVYLDIEKDEAERSRTAKLEASPIAQLVRAPH